MDKQHHLQSDKFNFGYYYPEVHEWLDELFPKYRDYRHWLERHHLKAIKDKYGEFTTEYNVAYLHILYDYLSHHQIAFVPVDAKEAQIMLTSLGALLNGTENFC